MIRRPPRSTQSRSSAASDVYKRQVQGVVDLLRRDAETRGRRAVDDDGRFEALRLLVAVEVREAFDGPELLKHLRRPDFEVLLVVGGKRVLVLGARREAADAEVLHGLQKQAAAGHGAELSPQAPDDLVRGGLALV